MKKILLALILMGCGPTWGNVIKHPDGTLEDPETHECWVEQNNGQFIPVECPTYE